MGLRHPALRSRARLPAALPVLWLVTDERQGEALWRAIERLPRGSGVLFRHHATAAVERDRLFDRIVAYARRRQLNVVREEQAGDVIARVHSLREARVAGPARLMFVSPVFATRTHPGARALGPLRAARIARVVRIPAIALGGMSARRFRRMQALGFAGWAAIDALTP